MNAVAEVAACDLQRALRTVKPVVGRRYYGGVGHGGVGTSSEAVRLRGTGAELSVEAVDGQNAARVMVWSAVDSTLDVVVDFKPLEQALRASRADDIELQRDGEALRLRVDARTITLPTHDLDNWPTKVDFEDRAARLYLLGDPFGPPLGEVLARAASCVSLDDTRPLLAGLHLDERYAVATDSFRLVALELPLSDGEKLPEPITLPAKLLVKAVGRSCDVEIADSGPWVYVSGEGHWRLRKVDGQYPRWRDLYPDESDVRAAGWVDREPLAHSLKAAAAAIGAKVRPASDHVLNTSRPVAVSPVDDELVFESPDGLFSERVRWEPEAGTEKLRVGFNPALLASVLDAVRGDQVKLQLTSPIRPGIIVGTDGHALLMPIRID